MDPTTDFYSSFQMLQKSKMFRITETSAYTYHWLQIELMELKASCGSQEVSTLGTSEKNRRSLGFP